MRERLSGLALAVLILAIAVLPVACTASQISQAEALTQVILQDVPLVLEILAGAGVLAGPQLTAAQAATGQASADFSLVEKLITDYKAQPAITTAQKIHAALADAELNLQAILAASRVLNPQKQQTILGRVTLILNTSSQIAAVFPVTASASAVKTSNKVQLPSAKDFQKQFNAILGAK